ncbi:hypothetical protein FD09_GL001520 [Schleiferilactobacillus perolens DSM 12744]|uniref:Uncharacterized protein n=1 Tax=Schleiferilactobacillus perolens DSM 12744 TaxID=1423792 RepID=A0A0R1MM74_9LACO|nr:hypothetical protein FD09_GL001520 [Schleiferilactobacillus perolens DSM 12744]
MVERRLGKLCQIEQATFFSSAVTSFLSFRKILFHFDKRFHTEEWREQLKDIWLLRRQFIQSRFVIFIGVVYTD